MNNFWSNFQSYLGMRIPVEIIHILEINGYDNTLAMCEITDQEICAIERNSTLVVGEKTVPIFKSSNYYSKWNFSDPFSFLPGHRKLIRELGKKAAQYKIYMDARKENDVVFSDLSFIMQEMLKAAKQNKNLAPTSHRYSEALQWFSTYIYILSGKAAYEVLSNNLPLPQASTVCK